MTLNIYQQVLGLSMCSNLLGSEKGSLDVLQNKIYNLLPDEISKLGAWNVAWGPVVWKDINSTDTDGPDNVWYVAYDQIDTYVVAIAGTATHSKYDQFHEDYDVNTVVDLLAWIGTGLNKPFAHLNNVTDGDAAYISAGTALGLTALLNNAPQSTSPGGNTALLADFLGALPTNSKIIFTGHSLGGALAPALAVTLLHSTMKNVPKENTFTYPSAGPTIGNATFVALYEESFPAPANPSGYQNWNVNLVNTLDVVPMAWCADPSLEPVQNIRRIPSFYDPEVDCKNALNWLMEVFMLPPATKSGVIYRPLKASSFTPPLDKDGQPGWPVKNPQVVFSGLDPDHPNPCWLDNAHWEHVEEYVRLVKPKDGPSLLAAEEGIIPGEEQKPTDERVDHWPVLRNIVHLAKNRLVTAAAQGAKVVEG